MADFSSLISQIQADIKTNLNQEITGAILQQDLLAMINLINQLKQDTLAGYAFYGKALSNGDSVSVTQNTFFLVEAGTYTINGTSVTISTDGISVIVYDSTTTTISTATIVEYDSTPTSASTNPVTSGGIYTSLATKQDTLTFDNTPTNSSTNPVTSGGVYTALADKQDKDTDAVDGNAAMMDSNGNSVDAGYAADNVALQDGSYPNLIAGSAENLVGRGSVAAEYTFRTSGGTDDIGTGTAVIKSMLGKSIVWNQLVTNGNFASASDWAATDGTFSVSNNVATFTATAQGGQLVADNITRISGHKYLISVVLQTTTATTEVGIVSQSGLVQACKSSTSRQVVSTLHTAASDGTWYVGIMDNRSSDWDAVYVENFMVIDLTLMGIAAAVSTVNDFKALYYLLYYGHNAGAIVSNTATGIKTIGFNQWDEEWEVGTISRTTGQDAYGPNSFRSKNYIPVFPNTVYCLRFAIGSGLNYVWYDSNKQYISGTYTDNSLLYNIVTSPANARYLRIGTNNTSSPTYNNDICINLSWSGWRNGEYEAYWENTQTFNLATITGVPSGSTTSETIFPNGMRGVGDAYDELVADSDGYARTANVVIASQSVTGSIGDTITLVDCDTSITDFLCDAGDIGTLSGGVLTLTADVSAVEVIYKLATPVEYTLDTPVYLGYPVDDFGTEQRLPADTESAVAAPIFYNVQYPFNAVDTLRRLPVNYLSKASTENLLTALQTAGIISAYTMTYNSTSEEYEFTITQ